MRIQFLQSPRLSRLGRRNAGSPPAPSILASALGYYSPANADPGDAGLVNQVGGVAIASKANVLRWPGGHTVRPQNAPYLALANGVTITYNYGDGPAAGQRTMRLQSTNTAAVTNPQHFIVPAGTYTLAWEGRAISTPVSVRAGKNTAMEAFSYTTEWQTFTTTFTSTGAAMGLYLTYYNGAAFDIELANIRVSKGAGDLGLDATLPFLFEYLDGTATPALTTPEWRANGLVQRHERKTISAFTAVWQMKCGPTAPTATTYLWQVSDGGFAGLSVMVSGPNINVYLNGAPQSGASTALVGVGQTVISTSISASRWCVLRNGLPILIRDISFTPIASAFVSTAMRQNLPADWSVGAFGFWDEGLPAADLAAASSGIEAAAASGGLAVEDRNAAYYALGDSITVGNPTSSYATQGLANAGIGFGRNLGVSGGRLIEMRAAIDRWLPYWAAAADIGKTPVVSVMIGHNDYTDLIADASGYYDDVMVEVARLKSAGCAVIMCDILPSNRAAGFNAARGIFNGLLATNEGTDFDHHCDFSATTTGTDGAETNTTYYSDGIHPTQTGQNELYPVFNAVLATAIAAA